jgi:hypothetical protein
MQLEVGSIVEHVTGKQRGVVMCVSKGLHSKATPLEITISFSPVSTVVENYDDFLIKYKI